MVDTKTLHVRTLIIGGGISGLATAWALEKKGDTDYLVLEKSAHPGGLCATTFTQGYYFDYSGHFLHLHTQLGKTIIKELVGTNLKKHTRRAFIYTNGMHVPYPFQQNLWAFHPQLRKLVTWELTTTASLPQTPQNFEQWCIQSFGYTLYEAFFRPYNEKLWGRPLHELTCEWCGPFVPLPNRKEILQSTSQPPHAPAGYNSHFFYPKTGGCGALVNALAARVQHIQLNTPLTRLDLAHKTAWAGTQKITFNRLVNTMALPDFVNLLTGQTHLKQWAAQLQSQAVTVYHLAIARKLKPFSWIYFPDPVQPFYRIGLESHFSPDSVPDKHTSLLYIELPGLAPTSRQTEKAIWEGLYQKGIVDRDDIPLFSYFQQIPHAYVVFNKQRAHVLPALLSTLEQQHCYCIGRYARWEYSFMESSLLQATALAQKLV